MTCMKRAMDVRVATQDEFFLGATGTQGAAADIDYTRAARINYA